jgi:excinuclease ABC subunit A
MSFQSPLVLKEIHNRASFLVDVGLDYLTLDRLAMTLSGGEAQRIRLATQIGSRLSGVLYVLDEPSIGLHQRDNAKLISTLKEMRDLGNTLIVVEHDEETMRNADYLVDIGPGAGIHGGEVVATGSVEDIEKSPNSITGDYLAGRKFIAIPANAARAMAKASPSKGRAAITSRTSASRFPLGEFVVVTGVSGSRQEFAHGNETLVKAIQKKLTGEETFPGAYKFDHQRLAGDRQSRQRDPGTDRAHPAEQPGHLYQSLRRYPRSLQRDPRSASERGFDKGRFSFNVPGGRCEKCQGAGVVYVPMNFLPDVYVKCDECDGRAITKRPFLATTKARISTMSSRCGWKKPCISLRPARNLPENQDAL